jgi:hypothetical protein
MAKGNNDDGDDVMMMGWPFLSPFSSRIPDLLD